jgi:DNA-binding NarL/FixJ family response regulator
MFSKTTIAGRILIVESNPLQAELYADVISIHCPGTRIDAAHATACPTLDDNAGGADLALCSCGPTDATRFDDLRRLLTARPCLRVLMLIPAELPHLADEAIACGASAVLLRAPGYLQQLPITVRSNIARAQTATQRRTREQTAARELRAAKVQIVRLETELAALAAGNQITTRASRPLPLPVITKRRSTLAAA